MAAERLPRAPLVDVPDNNSSPSLSPYALQHTGGFGLQCGSPVKLLSSPSRAIPGADQHRHRVGQPASGRAEGQVNTSAWLDAGFDRAVTEEEGLLQSFSSLAVGAAEVSAPSASRPRVAAPRRAVSVRGRDSFATSCWQDRLVSNDCDPGHSGVFNDLDGDVGEALLAELDAEAAAESAPECPVSRRTDDCRAFLRSDSEFDKTFQAELCFGQPGLEDEADTLDFLRTSLPASPDIVGRSRKVQPGTQPSRLRLQADVEPSSSRSPAGQGGSTGMPCGMEQSSGPPGNKAALSSGEVHGKSSACQTRGPIGHVTQPAAAIARGYSSEQPSTEIATSIVEHVIELAVQELHLERGECLSLREEALQLCASSLLLELPEAHLHGGAGNCHGFKREESMLESRRCSTELGLAGHGAALAAACPAPATAYANAPSSRPAKAYQQSAGFQSVHCDHAATTGAWCEQAGDSAQAATPDDKWLGLRNNVFYGDDEADVRGSVFVRTIDIALNTRTPHSQCSNQPPMSDTVSSTPAKAVAGADSHRSFDAQHDLCSTMDAPTAGSGGSFITPVATGCKSLSPLSVPPTVQQMQALSEGDTFYSPGSVPPTEPRAVRSTFPTDTDSPGNQDDAFYSPHSSPASKGKSPAPSSNFPTPGHSPNCPAEQKYATAYGHQGEASPTLEQPVSDLIRAPDQSAATAIPSPIWSFAKKSAWDIDASMVLTGVSMALPGPSSPCALDIEVAGGDQQRAPDPCVSPEPEKMQSILEDANALAKSLETGHFGKAPVQLADAASAAQSNSFSLGAASPGHFRGSIGGAGRSLKNSSKLRAPKSSFHFFNGASTSKAIDGRPSLAGQPVKSIAEICQVPTPLQFKSRGTASVDAITPAAAPTDVRPHELFGGAASCPTFMAAAESMCSTAATVWTFPTHPLESAASSDAAAPGSLFASHFNADDLPLKFQSKASSTATSNMASSAFSLADNCARSQPESVSGKSLAKHIVEQKACASDRGLLSAHDLSNGMERDGHVARQGSSVPATASHSITQRASRDKKPAANVHGVLTPKAVRSRECLPRRPLPKAQVNPQGAGSTELKSTASAETNVPPTANDSSRSSFHLVGSNPVAQGNSKSLRDVWAKGVSRLRKPSSYSHCRTGGAVDPDLPAAAKQSGPHAQAVGLAGQGATHIQEKRPMSSRLPQASVPATKAKRKRIGGKDAISTPRSVASLLGGCTPRSQPLTESIAIERAAMLSQAPLNGAVQGKKNSVAGILRRLATPRTARKESHIQSSGMPPSCPATTDADNGSAVRNIFG